MRCFTAEILHARGLQLTTVREQLARADYSPPVKSTPAATVFSIVVIGPTPAGADIQVDDAFVGHIPAELSLAAGEGMVAIAKKGYKPWRRKLPVLPGSKQVISAELEQLSE